MAKNKIKNVCRSLHWYLSNGFASNTSLHIIPFSNVHDEGARDDLVQSGYGDKLRRLALPTAMLL
jgi:hypothetical protein